MSRRTPLKLDAVGEAAAKPESPPPAAVEAVPAEPTATVYARVPWSLGEKLKDLARERSRLQRRRVTVQELVTEAISKLVNQQD